MIIVTTLYITYPWLTILLLEACTTEPLYPLYSIPSISYSCGDHHAVLCIYEFYLLVCFVFRIPRVSEIIQYLFLSYDLKMFLWECGWFTMLCYLVYSKMIWRTYLYIYKTFQLLFIIPLTYLTCGSIVPSRSIYCVTNGKIPFCFMDE